VRYSIPYIQVGSHLPALQRAFHNYTENLVSLAYDWSFLESDAVYLNLTQED
jgi:hypothetical protein